MFGSSKRKRSIERRITWNCVCVIFSNKVCRSLRRFRNEFKSELSSSITLKIIQTNYCVSCCFRSPERAAVDHGDMVFPRRLYCTIYFTVFASYCCSVTGSRKFTEYWFSVHFRKLQKIRSDLRFICRTVKKTQIS